MLLPRLTNCPECANIPDLIKVIDCKLAEYANGLYNNITLMLYQAVPAGAMIQLIAYRRILIYKDCNPDYVSDVCINDIVSRVKMLTFGCQVKPMYTPTVRETTTTTTTPCPTTTSTSTTAGPTTTTTTTINPLAGDFTINIGSALDNVINSVTPNFFNVVSGDFPVIFGEALTGKVLTSGTSLTVNYNCPSGTPQILMIKNGNVVGNDSGIPQGTGLNHTYNISWVDSDDIVIALNYM